MLAHMNEQPHLAYPNCSLSRGVMIQLAQEPPTTGYLLHPSLVWFMVNQRAFLGSQKHN